MRSSSVLGLTCLNGTPKEDGPSHVLHTLATRSENLVMKKIDILELAFR